MAFQSGRYLETIGFLSISGLAPKSLVAKFEARKAAANNWFPSWRSPIPSLTADEEVLEKEWSKGITISRRYIDANPLGFQFHSQTNASTFHTEKGLNLSRSIASYRKELDLDKTYGCAPKTYYVNLAPYPSENSLFTLMVERLLPSVLSEHKHGSAQTFISGDTERPKIALMNTGGLRFDVFEGKFTRDTVYIVSPFENRWKVVRSVPWKYAKHVLPLINSGGQVMIDSDAFGTADMPMSKKEVRTLHEMWRMAPPEQMSWMEDRVSSESHKVEHEQAQKIMNGGEDTAQYELTPGYTTIDDLDSHGDDTVHSPMNYYRVPNAIQANVGWGNRKDLDDNDTVDVVFLDFVQPWIVIALRFLGQKVEENDVESYLEGKGFTTMIKEWVQENWYGNC